MPLSQNKPKSLFTHAGGVVFRLQDGEPYYLIVQARNNSQHWLLPKGHLEPGETPPEAAIREVEEETGVRAEVIAELGQLCFVQGEEEVRVAFYLLAYQAPGVAQEARPSCWLPFAAAQARLTFANTRELLARAHRFLQQQLSRPAAPSSSPASSEPGNR